MHLTGLTMQAQHNAKTSGRVVHARRDHVACPACPPSPPIRIVSSRSWCRFAPGGGTDAVARTLAQEMAKELGGSVIIENKPGAGTILGTQPVAAARPMVTRC